MLPALLPLLLPTLAKVAGLACAFILLRQDRRAAGFALAGFAVLVVDNLINVAWLVYFFTQRELPFGGAGPAMIGFSLCQQLLFVVGLVLVIIAVRLRFNAARPAEVSAPAPWTVPPASDAPPAPGPWTGTPEAAPQSDAWPAPPVADAPPTPGAPPPVSSWTPPGQGNDVNNSGSSSGSGMPSSSG